MVYGDNPVTACCFWERLWSTWGVKSACSQIDVQKSAKTIVLLVQASICIECSSRRTRCGVLHGRELDLHASSKAHCFRQIQVLRKDFSEELLLLYQALAKDTVQPTIKTHVKYGIPIVKISHFRSMFLCKSNIFKHCIKKSAIAHPWSFIKDGIDIPSDPSTSNLRFSIILAVAGAASRFVPILANVMTSSSNTSSYLSLPTLTSRLISYWAPYGSFLAVNMSCKRWNGDWGTVECRMTITLNIVTYQAYRLHWIFGFEFYHKRIFFVFFDQSSRSGVRVRWFFIAIELCH